MTIEKTLDRIATALETIAASCSSRASEPVAKAVEPVVVATPTPQATPAPVATPVAPEVKPPFTTAAEAKQYVIDAYMPIASDAVKVEGMRQILERLKLEGDALDRIKPEQFQGLFDAIEEWRKQ